MSVTRLRPKSETADVTREGRLLDDPAFAAIKRFKAIDAETHVTMDLEDKMSSAEYPAWEAKRDEEMTRWNALRRAMFQTVPTTQAGALALVAEVRCGDSDSQDALMLIDTLAKAVRS